MAPWKLPLIVLAITVPVIAAFAVGGAGVGVAVGALAAVVIVVVAARQRPRDPIVPPTAADGQRHVLIVVTCPADEPATVREIARHARLNGNEDEGAVLVLAPARIGFLDRWTSDTERARREAQQRLVTAVAALAKAGIAAEARVGDEDVVQAVEDQLGSFPADEVILVSGGSDADQTATAAAAELESRLQAEFHHVTVSPPGR